MVVLMDTRPAKRTKRSSKVTADLYDFFTFPDESAGADLPFRQEIQCFLSKHARFSFQPSSLFSPFTTWQILFRVQDLNDCSDLSIAAVALYIVEEDVTRSNRSVYCDHCRVVGWSGHPVCNKRYHFIIRSECVSNGGGVDGFHNLCSICGNILDSLHSSCKCCNKMATSNDVEDWLQSQFEDNSHILHGLVHSNGYGHLLTVNGREGGSKFLSGSHILNFWDRLCRGLAVRKVTVMDVSKKHGMEYRLLHAITKGHSWYGEWGFEFKYGSYGLTGEAYESAVAILSSMPIYPLLFKGRKPRSRLQAIIAFYQSISTSELLTFKDLFSFLLELINENHTLQSCKNHQSNCTSVLCTWRRDDVEHVQQAMVKILVLANGDSWVSRRALKGVMYKSASLELLDYSIKHFRGKLTDNGMVVQARCNPQSNDLEFRLETLSSYRCGSGGNYPTEEHVRCDLKYIYDALLNPGSMIYQTSNLLSEKVNDLASKVLDCKQFIKEYMPITNNNCDAIHVWCHVDLSDQPKGDPVPPAELLVLPSNATIADLKSEVSKVFQEVYVIFKRFEVEELLEYGQINESFTLNLLIGSSGSIRVKGRCPSKHGLQRYRMERGTENWTVDCMCGAKDDDGEKMLACDTCGVWQHTRCVGIINCEDMPTKFVCLRCISDYRKFFPDSKNDSNGLSVGNTDCKNVALKTNISPNRVELPSILPNFKDNTDCKNVALKTSISTDRVELPSIFPNFNDEGHGLYAGQEPNLKDEGHGLYAGQEPNLKDEGHGLYAGQETCGSEARTNCSPQANTKFSLFSDILDEGSGLSAYNTTCRSALAKGCNPKTRARLSVS